MYAYWSCFCNELLLKNFRQIKYKIIQLCIWYIKIQSNAKLFMGILKLYFIYCCLLDLLLELFIETYRLYLHKYRVFQGDRRLGIIQKFSETLYSPTIHEVISNFYVLNRPLNILLHFLFQGEFSRQLYLKCPIYIISWKLTIENWPFLGSKWMLLGNYWR